MFLRVNCVLGGETKTPARVMVVALSLKPRIVVHSQVPFSMGLHPMVLKCAITKTAMYTEVFYYLDWINSTISEQGFKNNLNAKSCCGCTGSVEEEEDWVNCASSGGSLGSSNGNQT
mmetsp:Transcript_13319/g.18164  ORF Transcript_13319/g.18164 Transcript_13319/m.18164 type:complete len:117 (-) Transcript_13319:107-457(-)